MNWRDLLETGNERLVAPWIGGRFVRLGPRTWTLEDTPPHSHGWFTFAVRGRSATPKTEAPLDPEAFVELIQGYLAGDRLVPPDVNPSAPIATAAIAWPKVYLVEPTERFTLVTAGRVSEDGPLIFVGLEFPQGPEEAVRHAYEDRKVSLADIADVTPELEAAFQFETYIRLQIEERQRRVEAARQAALEREQALASIGTAAGRREAAKYNFADAAKAALRIAGAEYLDHRTIGHDLYAVKFRFIQRRFECTCTSTLRIVDSGVCLTEHDGYGGDFEYGTRGDDWLTLESLPAVILEAEQLGKLVIFRHV